MSDQVWVDHVRAENHARWDRPFPVRYLLVAEDRDEDGHDRHLLGRCAAVEGLFTDPPPAPLPVRLIGCEPAEPLRARLADGYRSWPTYTELWVLDDSGRVLDRVPTGLAVDRTWPSALGGGLLDVLLSVSPGPRQLPGSAAREVWRSWRAGPPRQPGGWRGLPPAAKEVWQTLALYLREAGPDRSGGEYHLDGGAWRTFRACTVRSVRP